MWLDVVSFGKIDDQRAEPPAFYSNGGAPQPHTDSACARVVALKAGSREAIKIFLIIYSHLSI